MKARNLILSLGITALALSGPVLAGDTQELRQALHADAGESIRTAGSEMLSEALSGFGLESLTGERGIPGIQRPELPARDTVIRLAESDTDAADYADTSTETATEVEESFLGGLVVYSGNR